MRSTVLGLFLLFAGFSFAWWDPSFQYRTAINISNSGSALTDYQVQLNPTIYNNTGLVGSWHFSEGAGTKAGDSSGSNNDGTLVSSPVWVSGKFGNALQFSGANYVNAGAGSNLAFTSAVTLEAWIKPGSFSVYGPVFGKSGDYSTKRAQFIWLSNPSSPQLYSTLNGNTCIQNSAVGSVPLNVLSHVAFVFNGATAKLYINGTEVSSVACALTLADNSATPLTIGFDSNNIYYFNGLIDEARAYSRALPAVELLEHYNATKARLDYADLRFTQPYTIYEAPITISGAGSDLADYQVLINITDPAILSHMRSDGADLRFFSSATSAPYTSSGLSYWIENITSSQARVWVKANVSSGGSTLYLYYGNVSAASASNGSKVFVFFDEFNSGSLPDPSKWGGDATGFTVANGLLKGTSTTGKLSSMSSFSAGTILETKVKVVSLPTNCLTQPSFYVSSSNGYSVVDCITAINVRNEGVWGYSGSSDPLNTNLLIKISAKLSNLNDLSIKNYDNGTVYHAVVDNPNTVSSETIRVGQRPENAYPGEIYEAYWDWIRVRKYASLEPSVSIGAETAISSGLEASLPYWLESDKSAWVKVPSIPASASTIYSYYGSPSASSVSNGSATFLFFDDFSGASLDPSKWDSVTGPSGGSVSVGSGALTVASLAVLNTGGRVRSKVPFTLPYVYKVRARDDNTQTYMFSSWGMSDANTVFAINVGNDIFGLNSMTISHAYSNALACTAGTCTTAAITRNTNWHVYDVYATSSSVKYYQDAALKGTVTTNIPSMPLNFTVKTMTHDAYAPVSAWNTQVDYLFIRKYASSEPSASGGVEQQSDVAPPGILVSSPAGVTYSSVSVPLNFTASDASGVSQCKYELNGVNMTLAVCQNVTMTAQSGSNSLVVWAFDGSNWGSASVSFNVSLDTTPPSVLITSPANVSYSSAPVPVNFVVSDASAYFCVVRLNGVINYSSCANSSLGLGNGAYILNVTANDTFGNVNSSAVSFMVNLTVSVSNSTLTNSNGIGNLSLNGIPSGASLIVYSVGSQSYSKSFSASSGVSAVRISARATLQGTPVSGRTLAFAVS